MHSTYLLVSTRGNCVLDAAPLLEAGLILYLCATALVDNDATSKSRVSMCDACIMVNKVLTLAEMRSQHLFCWKNANATEQLAVGITTVPGDWSW